MKYILSIFLAAAFSVTGCKQSEPTSFTVKGTVDSSLKADSALIFVYASDTIIARAPIVDGKFELKGSISEPQMTRLLYKTTETEAGHEKGFGELFLENADYTVERKDGNAKIKGGKLHDMTLGYESADDFVKALNEYEAATMSVYDGKDDFYEPTPEEKKRIKEKFDAGIALKKKYIASVLDNPDAPILAKVVAIGETPDEEKYPIEKRIEMLDAYEKELGHPSLELNRQRDGYKNLMEGEKTAKTLAPGNMYKDIEVKDANGKTIKLSEVVAKNKFTILEFWASWCGPCRGEIPNLKKAYKKYKSKGLEIYSVSIDEKQEDWIKALKEEDTPWINVVDGSGFKGKMAKDYGILGVPTGFLIGQDGKIVAVSKELRGLDLDRTLSKHMP